MHFVVILDLVHLCEKYVKNPFMCFFSVFNENVLKLIYVVFSVDMKMNMTMNMIMNIIMRKSVILGSRLVDMLNFEV